MGGGDSLLGAEKNTGPAAKHTVAPCTRIVACLHEVIAQHCSAVHDAHGGTSGSDDAHGNIASQRTVRYQAAAESRFSSIGFSDQRALTGQTTVHLAHGTTSILHAAHCHSNLINTAVACKDHTDSLVTY
jgi:hypothetical protein